MGAGVEEGKRGRGIEMSATVGKTVGAEPRGREGDSDTLSRELGEEGALWEQKRVGGACQGCEAGRLEQ